MMMRKAGMMISSTSEAFQNQCRILNKQNKQTSWTKMEDMEHEMMELQAETHRYIN